MSCHKQHFNTYLHVDRKAEAPRGAQFWLTSFRREGFATSDQICCNLHKELIWVGWRWSWWLGLDNTVYCSKDNKNSLPFFPIYDRNPQVVVGQWISDGRKFSRPDCGKKKRRVSQVLLLLLLSEWKPITWLSDSLGRSPFIVLLWPLSLSSIVCGEVFWVLSLRSLNSTPSMVYFFPFLQVEIRFLFLCKWWVVPSRFARVFLRFLGIICWLQTLSLS